MLARSSGVISPLAAGQSTAPLNWISLHFAPATGSVCKKASVASPRTAPRGARSNPARRRELRAS
eukprot:8570745-Pyramimonas_sp.AAC.1